MIVLKAELPLEVDHLALCLRDRVAGGIPRDGAGVAGRWWGGRARAVDSGQWSVSGWHGRAGGHAGGGGDDGPHHGAETFPLPLRVEPAVVSGPRVC